MSPLSRTALLPLAAALALGLVPAARAQLIHGGGGANDIVGKSVIVHAKEDDFKTQPSGNSGARIAGGVIEMKK